MQIHFRFATAGDAVQKVGFGCGNDCVIGVLLLGRKSDVAWLDCCGKIQSGLHHFFVVERTLFDGFVHHWAREKFEQIGKVFFACVIDVTDEFGLLTCGLDERECVG